MSRAVVVQKFGSSVLTDRGQLPIAVHDVYRAYRRGHSVVVVVSAMGRHTDLLLDEVRHFAEPGDSPAAVAMLLATGETQAAALLCLALQRGGVPASALDTAAMGLVAHGDRLDADPLSVDVATIRRALNTTPVIVVPGFAALHEDGGLAVMGRGGSDLTAVFLAQALGATARLIKDVDGIYERDPAKKTKNDDEDLPHRYGSVTYVDALLVANVLVQPKAVEFLQQHQKTAEVTALLHDRGTTVGADTTEILDANIKAPLRVVVLGFGTVGQGVVERLDAMPEDFAIVGIGVLNPHKHRDNPLAQGRLTLDIDELLEKPHDVVVELTGDMRFAERLVAEQLGAGIAVVTANKAMVAAYGIALDVHAAANATHFAYSAAVGGSTPMLEAIRRCSTEGRVVQLRGVLNGTSNVVLQQLSSGVPMDEAKAYAQARGFAEANSDRDLSGADAADKLRILAHIAFATQDGNFAINRVHLHAIDSEVVAKAHEDGCILRQVATADGAGNAAVRLEWLSADDFLAQGAAEDCRLLISGEGGREWRVKGKGAGRWPSTEAVIADLIDLRAASRRPVLACDTEMSARTVAQGESVAQQT